jgi:hypothetical protein
MLYAQLALFLRRTFGGRLAVFLLVFLGLILALIGRRT